MQLARVIATATATVKHRSMLGQKLLVLRVETADGIGADGDPLVAIDGGVGAGLGDRVMITSDGRFSRSLLKDDNTPVRWTIVGIADP